MKRDDVEFRYLPAALNALAHFPVRFRSIRLVTHSENVTFRVSPIEGDTDFALRLHRPGYNSIEELESERLWMRALKDTGVSVQDSLGTLEGGYYALVDIPGGDERRYAGVTTWLEGRPLRDFLEACSDGPERQRLLGRFGEIAAAFHNQSTAWQAPPGFTRRRLALDELLGEAPFWGRFWEHPELTGADTQRLLRARESLRGALGAYGERPDNFSLIHADFTPDNIIYDGHDLAVIDFDDCAFGWHLYDIASALVECLFDEDFEALQDAFLEAYGRCRGLSSRDTDMLPDFLLVRGMAIIGWFYQRPEYDGLAYFERFKAWVLEECERRGY